MDNDEQFGRCHVIRQVAPGLWDDNRECPVGDVCQTDRKHYQKESLAARYVGDVVVVQH